MRRKKNRNAGSIKSGIMLSRNTYFPIPPLFFPIVSLTPNHKIIDVDFVNQTKTIQQLTKITITSNAMFVRGVAIGDSITTDEDIAVKEFLAVK